MKSLIKLGWIALSVGIILQLSSCDPSEDPEAIARERNRELLTQAPWNVQSVVVDGVDKTSVYSGLVLTFGATSYSAVKGGVVWPATGSWDFQEGNADVILRSDGVPVQIVSISSSTLEVTLTWSTNTFGGGRVGSVSGAHTFKFTR